ncbi:MAG: helix-turn-helix transcriptional regulator [Bacteroidota bacterium]|nr:helix-turn-helix transcriptional regulator [Bacteroidota bacterium]
MNSMHKDIRTYTFAENSQDYPGFALKRMEDIYRNSNGAPDKPHRHDYYTIIFIEQGEGAHFIDFTEYKVEDRTVFFILPGQMHQLVLTREPVGWVVTFTEEFLIANSIPEKLINDIYLFNDYGQSPPLPISEKDMPVYRNLISQMTYFAGSLELYTREAVGSLLKLFLIQSNNHCSLHKSNNPQLVETSNQILRTFKKSLNKKYATAHMVSEYADEMAVSSDYLNKTVKNLTGKSAKEHIQSKLITEAKRSLLFSNISNKELAYELGFEESAHFNNFFKKLTGQTPSEFRVSARQN